jgi:hypothetical protein
MVERFALGAAPAQRLEPATKRLLMHLGELRHPKDGGAGAVDSRYYGRAIFVAVPEGARCLSRHMVAPLPWLRLPARLPERGSAFVSWRTL